MERQNYITDQNALTEILHVIYTGYSQYSINFISFLSANMPRNCGVSLVTVCITTEPSSRIIQDEAKISTQLKKS